MANADLHKAKRGKNDEFYTQLEDIVAEVKHYPGQFAGQVVYCNCDDPAWSAFWRYFHTNFAALGLRELVATYHSFDENPRVCAVRYAGGDDANIAVGDVTWLKGNGDFQSPECLEILDACDIVVTNPPFSLFRTFIKTLFEHGKKFLIIGNLNAMTYKEIFPYFQANQLWFGPSITSGDRKFNVPDDYPLHAAGCGVDADGRKFIRVKGVRWFTNLDHDKRHKPLVLNKHYRPDAYLCYDNYNGINVDKTADIPADYTGAMGVPITFLDKYCPEQFEIVRFRHGDDGRDLVLTKNGARVQPYFRILIRRRAVGDAVSDCGDGHQAAPTL